ncbi:hypothetical protein QGM71_17350 [Virgibacillus sp. C22-A2]|uniref:Uncharacterized protein n=1 Tax=Virgibacillus tibetensis TaxID=3042313 RepID=A0ABU6KLF4_9BACI|nr:hypothetical protein [Virgibacillus sp. C22-A2]
MEEAISLSALKALIEKKIKKKTLIKVMWNDVEKITLFITPNMKINSFIFDDKEGYLFYDQEGNPVSYEIPCILSESDVVNGKAMLEGRLRIKNQPLSKEEIQFLKEYHLQ